MERRVSGHDRLLVGLGERSYEILIGEGLIAKAGELIAPLLASPRVLIVTDSQVEQLHLPILQRALDHAGIRHEAFVVPAGEASKSFERFAQLCEELLRAGVDRHSTLVALGGGVVGDLCGFAAAVLLRGIEFIQIPTTLLAQVDSSVGGKTGINTGIGKNLVGAFHQPKLVLADTTVLSTLPERDLLAGYAEVAKCGLLGDAAFFTWLEGHGHLVIEGDSKARREAVRRACAMKADVVAADEKEGGQRKLLNLGHTFGHALEAECGYDGDLLHGEAVAIGMVLAFELSAQLGHCSADDADRVRRHLSALDLPTGFERLAARAWHPQQLIEHMRHDKKARDGRLTFILAHGIGQAFVTDTVPEAEVEHLLTERIGEIIADDSSALLT
ncbi:3-dehydroquinate synthase [Aquibaculum sediminis]|uniref:3-dehydroquinate synthase n=1 Tax=Aquibaculum sediminis TaxID=3231907 RepID=UPI003F61EA59